MIETKNFKNGVYFIELEGQKSVLKMVIEK
jgi:hypothetical protein